MPGLDEGALLAQQLDDERVRVPHALAGEALDLGQEAAALVDRAVDVEPVADARQVVVPAVAGRRVDDAGAGVERHVVGQHAGRVAVDPGMPELDVLEVSTLRFGERRPERQAEALRRGLAERLRDEQDFVAALDREEAVVGLGMEGERQVGRQRPGRRGPGDGEDRTAREGGDAARRGARLSLGASAKRTSICGLSWFSSYSTSASASAVRHEMHQWTDFLAL